MGGCEVCGLPSCTSHPDIEVPENYPFLTGGKDRMPGKPVKREIVSSGKRRAVKGPKADRAHRLAETTAQEPGEDR